MPSAPPPAQSSKPLAWDREVRRFIEAGGNTTHAFGLGKLIGRMFALLYLHPRPLSLEEIAGLLDISKASASTTVRQLEQWHAVVSVPVAGDRRDFYQAETRFSLIIKNGLLPSLHKKLHSAGEQISRTLAAEPPRRGGNGRVIPTSQFTPTEFQEIRRRLRAARGLHQKMEGVLSSNLVNYFL